MPFNMFRVPPTNRNLKKPKWMGFWPRVCSSMLFNMFRIPPTNRDLKKPKWMGLWPRVPSSMLFNMYAYRQQIGLADA
jgi:hypothetical protein